MVCEGYESPFEFVEREVFMKNWAFMRQDCVCFGVIFTSMLFADKQSPFF